MNKKDEALRMAIEWFDNWEMDMSSHALKSSKKIVNACKAALGNEQLDEMQKITEQEYYEQEPVDVARAQEDGYVEWNPDLPNLPVGIKLYTRPTKQNNLAILPNGASTSNVYEAYEIGVQQGKRATKRLSDGEIMDIWLAFKKNNKVDIPHGLKYARAIETKLTEKNGNNT